jgi:hypothetical protein
MEIRAILGRLLLKAHVKSHYRVQGGKVVYIHEYDNKVHGEHPEASLHQRSALGVHAKEGAYIRATDAHDAKAIKQVADSLGVKVTKARRAGANHHGRTGAYDHLHFASTEDAAKVHAHLEGGPGAAAPKAAAPPPPKPEPPAAPAPAHAPEPAPNPLGGTWTPNNLTVQQVWQLRNTLPGHDKTYTIEIHKQPNGKFSVLTAYGKTGKPQIQEAKVKDATFQEAQAFAGKLAASKAGKGYVKHDNAPIHWLEQTHGTPAKEPDVDMIHVATAKDLLAKATDQNDKAAKAAGLAVLLAKKAGDEGPAAAATNISLNAYGYQMKGTPEGTAEAAKLHAKASVAHSSLGGVAPIEAYPPAAKELQPFHQALAHAHYQLANQLLGGAQDDSIVSTKKDPALAAKLSEWTAWNNDVASNGWLGFWPTSPELAATKTESELYEMNKTAEKMVDLATSIQDGWYAQGDAEEAASWTGTINKWKINALASAKALDSISEKKEAEAAAAPKANPKWASLNWGELMKEATGVGVTHGGTIAHMINAGGAGLGMVADADLKKAATVCKKAALYTHAKGMGDVAAIWAGRAHALDAAIAAKGKP